MFEHVDPFIGTDATDLPAPDGLAATWWWPKPQVGNTHPGRDPPARHGVRLRVLGRVPDRLRPLRQEHRGRARRDVRRPGRRGSRTSSSPAPARSASTTTTSGSRRWCEPLDDLGTSLGPQRRARRARLLRGDPATPGCAARSPSAPRSPSTGTRSRTPDARVVRRLVARRARHRATARRCRCAPTWTSADGRAQGNIVMEGVPLAVHLECDTPGWRQMLWYDRRLIDGGTRLDFDAIRQTTLRPFGLIFSARASRASPSRCAWASRCAAASRRGAT